MTQIVLKRFFDIILSITGLLIAVVPMVMISLCIKLTSPGPVLYHQKKSRSAWKTIYTL
ncbi:sugar transferase [Biomaibacter acetigenes]|uniref:sugar transferase n=1 Tax=Biomaibacter acetigenes TaxID=2316383 RepID=UPI0013CF2374